MTFSQLVLFLISLYIFYCGIVFFIGKTSTICLALYKILITSRVKNNIFYRKALGIDFIWIGTFGIIISLLFYFHNGFTSFDFTLIKIFFVIEILATIYLKIIYKKKDA